MAQSIVIIFGVLSVTVAVGFTFLWLVDIIHEAFERYSQDD